MTMWEELKASIIETIKQNGNNEITGNILQNILLTMVSALGENAQMAGEATPTTNPGTPDNKVFYVAQQPGVYSNFGGYTLQSGTIAFLFWDSEQWLTTTVTIGELNAIAVIKDWNGNTLTITNKSVQLPNPLFSDVLSARQGGETLVQALAKKANLASPALTGSPTAPTPAQNAAGTRIATVGFVRDYIAGGGGSSGEPNVIEIIYGYNNQPLPVINKAVHLPGVSGANVDIGGVDLNTVLQTIENTLSQKANAADVYTRTQSDALFFTQEDATYWLNLKADLYSPAFRGTPTAPTAANDSVPTQIATLQYVINKIAEAGSGGDVNKIEKIYAYGPNATEVEVTDREAWLPNVPSTAVIVEGVGADLDAVLQSMLQSISNRAMKNNASLTGTPTAPTPTTSSPDNQIATKKYVLDNAASGGNVRSNWQQNNPAADSYVENRTHYLQGSQLVFSAAPVDITPQAGFGGGSASGSMTLTRGKFYAVTISDGVTTYVNAESLKPKQDSNGNWYLSRGWEVTTVPGEPQGTDAFLVWDNGSGSVMIALTAAQSGQMEVSVSELVYVKLPLGYIPDEVANVDLTGYAKETWVGSNYVAKETGKGLSTNDFTSAEKTKLAGIEAGAEKNVQGDWAQNDTTADDHIKNRTHYVESVSTSDVWNQSGCTVGSGTTSPGGYSATFNMTIGDKYNVTIFQSGSSKTYEGLTAEYDNAFNGVALRKNWSDSRGMSDTDTDAVLIVAKADNVVLRSADIYGENCTVQVSEVTEIVHKLDPKYLPDINELESVTTQESSVSGGTNVVTFTQTNGTQTSFNVKNGEKGEAGATGATGPQGATGPTGPQGPKGDDGVSLGEIALVQQLSQDDDKVPSAKAVQDGIEVWRNDANIIYKADNIVLDGTNYVDTGIQLLAEDIDWTIEMVVTDVANSYASYDMFLSCRPNTSYGFRVYKVTANIIIMTTYNGSSGNVNINVGTGSVNRITVTKVGSTYTLTCNGVTVSQSGTFSSMTTTNPLIIGANVDYGNKGRFTLQSIRIYQSIPILQQYTDHTKTLPFYPKTSTDGVIGLEKYVKEAGSFSGTFSKYSIADFQELNPASCSEWSFFWDKRYQGIHGANNDLFVISSNDGTNSFTLRTNGNEIRFLQKKNGTETSTRIKSFGIEYQHIIFTFNLVTGAYVGYGNGVQYASGTLDTTKFPDLSTLETVTIANNDTNGQKYFAVFNCILLQTEVEEILAIYPQRALPMKFEATKFNYNNEDLSSAKATGTNVSYSDRTANSIKVTTSAAVGIFSYVTKDNIFNVPKMITNVHICEMHINVLSGGLNVVSLGVGAGNLDVYDNQGNYIGTGTGAGTLGSGEYDLIYRGQFDSSYNAGNDDFILRFSTSAATEFVLSDLLIKEVGAPLVFSPDTFRGTFWQMPNGNQIPAHSGLDISYDIYKPNVSTLSYPQYSGQLKMDADGTIYMGNIFKNTGVWKQISNS